MIQENPTLSTATGVPLPCDVCSETTPEGEDANGAGIWRPSPDAMYCEGKCDAWIHRKCAGLGKQQYETLTETHFLSKSDKI